MLRGLFNSNNVVIFVTTLFERAMDFRTIRIKGKNGTVYLYEDRSYRDKERGYSTHERKCIGKLDKDGNPVYNEYYLNRRKIRELEAKVSHIDAVSSTTLIGQRLILDREVEKTGLRKALDKAFGEAAADRVLALSYYLICRGKALSRSGQWLEDRGFGGLGLTTQRISELLGGLDDDRVNTFFKEWAASRPHTDRNYLFDITSVSTYGKDNPWAEFGYNRDGENLEQINLALLSSRSSGLPLWYSVLPGSMSDKVVLDETLARLKKLEIGGFTFCGDRGFFSGRNLKMLTDRGIRFTVPVPSSIKWGKDLIREHRDSLIHPSHFINDGKTKVYGKTVYKMTEHGRTWYHIFFDPARKDMMQASFMSRLQQCKDELEQNRPKECHQSIYDEFFIVKDSPKRGRRVIYDDEALQNYLNNDSCYWILLSNTEKDAAKALSSYRERGGVELSFDDIKNVLDLNRLRCHNERTVKGKVFVNFVALIILSKLRRTVDAVKPKDRLYMSEMDMLDKVETYSRIHFGGKYNDVYTTPTKAQRTVFDLLGIKYAYKGEELNADSEAPQNL